MKHSAPEINASELTIEKVFLHKQLDRYYLSLGKIGPLYEEW